MYRTEVIRRFQAGLAGVVNTPEGRTCLVPLKSVWQAFETDPQPKRISAAKNSIVHALVIRFHPIEHSCL